MKHLNEVKFTVVDVEVKGPFTAKVSGDKYNRHVYTTDDNEEFFQFAGIDVPPALKAGDSVQAYVDKQTTATGTSNKIIKILGEVTETTTTKSSKPSTSRSSEKPPFTASSKTTRYDSNGARTGMMVKAAVDLAIANCRSGTRSITATELSEALELVQNLTKEAEEGV